jgi:hypothetical protein
MKAQVTNRKIRTLAIFTIACLFTVVASRAFNWFVATHYSDVPSFVRNLFLGLVLVPPFWAGLELMDVWKKEETRLPDDKNI